MSTGSRPGAHEASKTGEDTIIIIDENGVVESVNPAGERTFGNTAEEIIGRNVSLLMNSPEREEHHDVLRGTSDASEPRESPVLTRDGVELAIEWHSTQIRNAAGRVTGTLNSGNDVTERERRTKKLVEQKSLAKLGEISTMVAHAVKNPLAGILGATRMLKNHLPEDSEEAEICDEMIARTMALELCVQDILTLARPQTPRIVSVSVRSILDDLEAIVARDPQFEGIAIDVSGRDVRIACDVQMLSPVFLNIIVNLAQEMERSEKISIVVDTASDRGQITFTDSGAGIPATSLQKIFEPFFTTKPRGTGLGLSIARRLVELHDGEIAVDCPPEVGTRVMIQIPLAHDPADEGEPS